DAKIMLEIPCGALYDTMMIRIIPDTTRYVSGELESVYLVEPRDQLLAGPVKIKIAHSSERDESGWGLCYFSRKDRWVFLGDDRDGDYYVGPALSWELFGLARDIDYPVITMEFPPDSAIFSNRRPTFKATINDSTFGVIDEGLTMRLNDSVVPAEWDPPRNRFSFEPWEELSIGEHQLVIEAVDRIGNITTRIVYFTITP
ncbi:MAG: hypothetical protein P9M15_07035, partial [Candidatus Electryoneaceae bacterium]|nr:hypothetical protein [Candidatus Electryoneaceae bacterium]